MLPAKLAITGAVFLAIALAWHPFFPINKKLWTSSFALFAGGWSLLLLAASICLVDILRLGRPRTDSDIPEAPQHPPLYKPLLVLGTNAILAYMVSELGEGVLRLIHFSSGANLKQVVVTAITTAVPSLQWSSLLYSLTFLFVCWLLVLPFYLKRIFLRI